MSASAAVEHVAEAAAKAIGAAPSEIFMASTGVIGEPLDGTRIARVLDALAADARDDALLGAAKAIMTTDTYPKIATARVKLGDADVTINGIAKGAGMIAPGHGDHARLRLHRRADRVGRAAGDAVEVGRALVQRDHRRQRHVDLGHADDLRHRRGRGARRISRTPPIRAPPRSGARSTSSCAISRNRWCATARARASSSRSMSRARRRRKAAKRIALSIANSPLVKTACGGEDANWGRVVMAVGKAGEKAERDKLDICFGKIRVAHAGLRDPAYDEAAASAYMKRDAIVITADLGIGRGRATVWTCDLTKDYVAINGDYRS